MAQDQLAALVQRSMTDRAFMERARADLEGTLTAEGISLSPEDLAAVRGFHAEVAGLSAPEVEARLANASRQQGAA